MLVGEGEMVEMDTQKLAIGQLKYWHAALLRVEMMCK
jgi:hypothetical protein